MWPMAGAQPWLNWSNYEVFQGRQRSLSLPCARRAADNDRRAAPDEISGARSYEAPPAEYPDSLRLTSATLAVGYHRCDLRSMDQRQSDEIS